MNKQKLTDAITALETAAQLHKDSVSYAQRTTEQITKAAKLITEALIPEKTNYEVQVKPAKHHLVTDDGLKLFTTDDSYREYIVNLAKEELNNLEKRNVTINVKHKEEDIIERGHCPLNGNYTTSKFDEVFHVNKKKRTVTCLLKGHKSGFVYSKGFAQCAKGDVFNEHLGKLIAFLRAANEMIPELFTNVPNPESVRNGDVVRHPKDTHEWEIDHIATVGNSIHADYHWESINYKNHPVSKEAFDEFKVIDDSNRK